MPDQIVENPGGVAVADPNGGATGAAAPTAAPGGQGGAPNSPAPAGADKPEDTVLDLGSPGGRQPTASPGQTPEERAAYLQTAHDDKARALNQVRSLQPDWFDDKGQYVGPAAGGEGESGTLDLGRGRGAARPGARAEAPTEPQGDATPGTLGVDPRAAERGQFNAAALDRLYTHDDIVTPVEAIVLRTLKGLGLDPRTAGQGGMTPEQVQRVAADVAARVVTDMDESAAVVEQRMDQIEAEFPGLLSLGVKFGDTPTMTLKAAVSRVCEEVGEPDPYWAIQKHPITGRVIQQIRAARAEAAATERLVSEGRGGQLVAAGGGIQALTAPGTPGGPDDIEGIGGGTEPLKR